MLIEVLVIPQLLCAAASTAPCDKTLADTNRGAGMCREAKCLSDDKYPPGCTRTSRYEMCDDCGLSNVPGATVSSNDAPPVPVCCEKMCHLETPDGKKCEPLGAATDFKSCAANGNPIMESYPEQCRDPVSGKTFVNEMQSSRAIGSGTSVPSASAQSPSKAWLAAFFALANVAAIYQPA